MSLKHGHSRRGVRSKTYKSWILLRSRCNNKNVKCFKNYGGKGVKVCKRWNKFSNFLKDMGERPEGKTIDRINTNYGYSPKNCRWSNGVTQARNVSDRKRQLPRGVTKGKCGFTARIGLNGKIIYLGHFKTEKKAKSAYLKAREELWK